MGFSAASRKFLPRFLEGVEAKGVQNIPEQGPLIIASNHPGTFDAFIIAACLPRDDIKFVARRMPFLYSLPAMDSHMIYTTLEPGVRMAAVRSILRHIKDGGTLVVFPSGTVDPDPAVLPGAEQTLTTWSSSLGYVLRKVPEAQLLVTIVSGVLSRNCLQNPLTRLRRGDWNRQILAEIIQVSQQLLLGRKFGLNPVVTFSRPVSYAKLQVEANGDQIEQAILRRARNLLVRHT